MGRGEGAWAIPGVCPGEGEAVLSGWFMGMGGRGPIGGLAADGDPG